VQIVVPYTPGTGADIAARTLGPKLSERWKVGVITDNRPGATGIIGTDFVARATPDGHVVLMTATSFATTPALNPKLPFDPVKSFAPVIQIAASELCLVVHPSLPVRSMQEFVQLAKRRPGQLHYSSPGNGGPQHLTAELIKLERGLDIVHVPHKGAAGAVTDLILATSSDGPASRPSRPVRAPAVWRPWGARARHFRRFRLWERLPILLWDMAWYVCAGGRPPRLRLNADLNAPLRSRRSAKHPAAIQRGWRRRAFRRKCRAAQLGWAPERRKIAGLETADVLIIGAGIGGLTLGLMLHRANFLSSSRPLPNLERSVQAPIFCRMPRG
jgi:hypothetical protein